MKDSIIKEYLGSIESAVTLGDKTKTFQAFNDARLKLFESLDPEVDSKKAPKKAPKNGNAFFEELECVGYYPKECRLEAVLKLKRQYGYAGKCPSGYGSYEYVAFYVNWNGDNDFTDSGEDVCSSYVHVFDPGVAIQKTGPICYAVYRDIIPPPRIRPCSIVRVRAILS